MNHPLSVLAFETGPSFSSCVRRLTDDGLAILATIAYDADTTYRVHVRTLVAAAYARPGEFDAIIIGDNEGLGPIVARALHPDLRAMALVVCSAWLPRRYWDYRHTGITQFGTRLGLRDCPGIPSIESYLREIACRKGLLPAS